MSKLHVAVLRGGPSYGYDGSLKTGRSALKNLSDKYHGHDIFISKDGGWHRDGVERNPGQALLGIDVVFNALHGGYGEDGKVQRILNSLSIPYTGSDTLPSALSMNKILTKKAFSDQCIKTPYHVVVKRGDDVRETFDHIFKHFYLPFVVKPSSGGSLAGTTIVKDFAHFEGAIESALGYGDSVIVEEYIRGKEASCGVIDGFRGEKTYVLMPVEIDRVRNREIHPGNFTHDEKKEIQRLARIIHEGLGLSHYSKSDFIIAPNRGIFALETNSLPSLADDSIFPKSLEAVGVNLPDFFDHVITLANSR